MIELLLIFAAAFLGYQWRTVVDKIMELEEKSEKPVKKPGVTRGSYNQVNEVHPTVTPKARGRVATPKTPQRVEYEAAQQLERENLKFRVGPK